MNGNRVALTLLWIVAILVLAPYIWMAGFAHPAADDFDFAMNRADYGFWTVYQQLYLEWNGRYTANALGLLVPIDSGSLVAYRAWPVGLLLGTVGAFALLARSLAGPALGIALAFGSGLFATILVLHLMPSPAEAYYWYSSAVTHLLPCLLMVVHISVVALACREGRSAVSRTLLLGLAALLALAAIGSNEVAMLLMVALHGTALVASVKQRSTTSRVFLGMFVVTMIGAALVVGSPGNIGRTSEYAGSHQIIRAGALSVLQAIRFDAEWVSSAVLLIASVLFVPLAARLTRSSPLVASHFHVHPVVPTIWTASIVALGAFPAYWGTGILGQHRTINTACFFFVPLWFMSIAAWVGFLAARGHAPAFAWPRRLTLGLCFGLLIVAGLTRTGYDAGLDLLERRPQTFDSEMRARYAAVQECRALGDPMCILPPLSAPPRILYGVELSTDPASWVNQGFARYWDVPSVALRPAGATESVADTRP